MKGYGSCKLSALLAVSILAAAIFACERASKEPPPENVARVMESIKTAYNTEDKEKFCSDFADIMFTGGFTKDAYLDVIREIKRKRGDWKSETYLGLDDRAHVWRVQAEKGRLKLILIVNEDSRVTGLWFRWPKY